MFQLHGIDCLRLAAQHRLFQHIAQFADVAAPGLGHQQGQGVGQQLGRRGAVAQRQVFAQHLDQGRNVAAPRTQRRHAQRQHMQAVEQVFAELATLHHGHQIARGGGHQAHIERHQLVRAQGLDLALLQGAQQLGLHAQRHVADFVQEQGAAVGQLELAIAPLAVGAGVGPGGHAKEFGLQQGVGHGGNVHAHERPAGARRRGMDRMGQQLLAGAGFAQQQHRTGGLGGAAGLALDFGGGGARADKAGEGVFGPALPRSGTGQRVAPLQCQLTAGIIQVALQQGKLADQGLQRGFGMIEQHDANRTDHPLGFIAQGNAADHKGAGPVVQQVHQHGLARLQHAAHLGVGDHLLDHPAQELAQRGKPQAGQEPLVTLVDPDDTALAVHQEHALADAGEQVEHGAGGQFQNVLGVQGQR